ncbi:MAG: Ubiquinone biosynthesis O-methyltransferase [Pseudomonadota bacterium]|jgi:SAM-dependent methyltransferase
MDKATLDYYATNAEEIAKLYEASPNSLASRFVSAFAAGGRILDIGCGSGRDLAELRRQGFQPYGVDGTVELVHAAQVLHPELHGLITHGLLPNLSVPFGGEFDGVLCSAVLMHIDATEIFNSALSIKQCLKINGRLLISIPSQRADTGENERDVNGRLFKSYKPGYLQLIFERLGFSIIDQWSNNDSRNRTGIAWTSLLFQLKSSSNTRPIDQIEGVLNHDKKSATYKFALFRALAEIATQSPNNVIWLPNDKVGLSVRKVAEKWLRYYWPLIESNTFIPQLNGENPAAGKQIKFRRRLYELVSNFNNSGGFSRFRIERNKDLLTLDNKKLLATVLAEIEYAIIKGPIEFSGGALITGRVFGYDSTTRQILIPNALWIELCHLGYWVSQAVVLQWAEKTTRLGKGLDVAMIVNLLLDKEDERTTVEARKFFEKQASLYCVWTGKSLKKDFDIDHVIPFDLWHNNDVWNLLPSSELANSKKSNKLPSAQLLQARRDDIIGYWEILRTENQYRFDQEASTLIAIPKTNWQTALFGQMCEAIEVTALQRGVGRWPGIKAEKN